MIEVVNLTKKYGSLTAIDGLSFHVRAGEVVGLLGPNGAGKTTSLRILTGYLPPTAGTVKIGGIDISKQPEEAKKKIGYLPENPPLYSELTVEESLQFVAGLRHLSDVESRIRDILVRTGTEGVRRRLVGALSKGYRQRVGIAQVLIHDPDVLIFDEPTIGLDPKQILEVRELLKASGGKRQAIIFSSHILQEVAAICERVIIIHQGKIVADGPISDLTSHSGQRRYLITASDHDHGIKGILEKVPGVEEVREYVTGLEELFLKLTEEKSNDAAPY